MVAALQPRCIRYLETAATQRDYPSSYEKRNVVVACCSVPERPETRRTRVFSSLLFRFNRGNRFYRQSSIFHGFSAKFVVIRWMRTTGVLPYNVVATLLEQQRNQVLLLHKGKGGTWMRVCLFLQSAAVVRRKSLVCVAGKLAFIVDTVIDV